VRDQLAHLLVIKGIHPGLDPLIAKIAVSDSLLSVLAPTAEEV
jgi:hypothetical protein